MRDLAMLRSYLYAPGSRPELMAKALRAGADAVVFDLEDAVDPAAKKDALAAVVAQIRQTAGRAGPQVHVRIGRGPDGFDLTDVHTVTGPGLAALRLPKCADPDEVRNVGELLDDLEARLHLPARHIHLYPTVESALGAIHAAELATAHPRVARLCFGATDFLADIGAPGEAHGPATLTTRSLLVLHSRAAGIGAPVDSVHTALTDEDSLRKSATLARELGFFGKAIIHPRQISAVHGVFAPSANEVAWASRVVAAFTEASQTGTAALVVDGDFVDPAVVARARSILALVHQGREA